MAAEVRVRHLQKPSSTELNERSGQAVEPAGGDGAASRGACRRRGRAGRGVRPDRDPSGRYAEGAAEAERSSPARCRCSKVIVEGLRLERFDMAWRMRLIAGPDPGRVGALGTGGRQVQLVADWLLGVVTERALAGTLDAATIKALDQCAYADLSPWQAQVRHAAAERRRGAGRGDGTAAREPGRDGGGGQAARGRPDGGRPGRAMVRDLGEDPPPRSSRVRRRPR
jgi:hypothetical protein